MIRKLGITVAFVTVFLFGATATYARCSDTKPVGKPVIVNAQPSDRAITLTWQGVPDPVTYYLLQFGPAKESMIYGNPNIGGRGATSYTVTDLQNGVKYYFQIRAGNGCRPGNFSDTASAVAGQGGLEAGELKTPVTLNIYKDVLGTGTAAIEKAKELSTPSAFPKPKVNVVPDPCLTNCLGLPLLAAEIIALAIFFLLATRMGLIKPILSILIPVATLIAFYAINGKCGQDNFYCEHFASLAIILYVLMLVVQKYALIDTNRKRK